MKRACLATMALAALWMAAAPVSADQCVDCHKRVTPAAVTDWQISKHAAGGVTCETCHGGEHTTAADAAQAQALIATAPPEGQPLAPWLDAQRARIAAARGEATQRYEATEKACWQRFAVNDCLRQARTERRAVLDRLRQQELAVNDLDRRRRADERLRQLERKPSGSDG